MLLVSALYPNRPGSRFDRDDYAGRHTAFARRLLEPRGLVSIRVTLGEAAMDGGPPPFWAIGELLFPDRATFDSAMAEIGAELMGDSVTYTDVEPMLQISRLCDA